MKTINVFIYSYKTKELLNSLSLLIDKESKNNEIKYYVFDQNSLDRKSLFDKIKNVYYRHIPWDDTKGITFYRKHVIFEGGSNYYLELSPDISLIDGWDQVLIESLQEKTILSGRFTKILTIANSKLIIDKKSIEDLSESNFIEMDLIFLRQKDSIILNQLQRLKHSGQDLYASAMYLSRGFKIFSMSSNFYEKNKMPNDLLYYPYSKTHGYNQMLDSLRSLDNRVFEDFHKIKVLDIPKLSYQIDDVLYHNPRTSLDNSVSTKFHSGYSRVQTI
jgi:hypothetical protein